MNVLCRAMTRFASARESSLGSPEHEEIRSNASVIGAAMATFFDLFIPVFIERKFMRYTQGCQPGLRVGGPFARFALEIRDLRRTKFQNSPAIWGNNRIAANHLGVLPRLADATQSPFTKILSCKKKPGGFSEAALSCVIVSRTLVLDRGESGR